jgi:hypothetical protein
MSDCSHSLKVLLLLLALVCAVGCCRSGEVPPRPGKMCYLCCSSVQRCGFPSQHSNVQFVFLFLDGILMSQFKAMELLTSGAAYSGATHHVMGFLRQAVFA